MYHGIVPVFECEKKNTLLMMKFHWEHSNININIIVFV